MSVINTNITSMIGQSNLSKSQNALQTSMERLSSGLRINSAKDDAAGQAIANRMSSQISGLAQAQRNANDGISVSQTAEGALNQVNDNLQRVRELAVQAANGTNSENDLQSIQDEIGQRLNEIDRISKETNFNGVNVLAEDQTVNIQVGANDGEVIAVNLQEITSSTLGLNNLDVRSMASVVDANAVARAESFNIEAGESPDASALTAIAPTAGEEIGGITIGADADPFVFSNSGAGDETGAELVAFDGTNYVRQGDNLYAATITQEGTDGDADSTLAISFDGDTAIDLSTLDGFPTSSTAGNAEFVFQDEDGDAVTGYTVLQDSNDNYFLRNSDGEFFAASVSQDGDNVVLQKDDDTALTIEAASAAGLNVLADMDRALNSVDSLRSELGAVQNRFEDAITNLSTNETNLAAARSRIEDADYAVEVADMTRAQILQQAGTSVLAQANQIPQNVLSLLG